MNRVLASAIFATAVAFGTTAAAQTGSVMTSSAPGKVGVAEKLKATATITAIDKAARDVTLKGPQGNEMTVTASSAVKNFDQLKVGDKVDLEYVEALTLELKKGGGMVVQRTEQSAVAGAKPGQTPAGATGRQVTVVADVVDVNAAKQTVTLRGPKQTVELPVRDPEQLKRMAKGDQIEATYTQAFAVTLVPTAKK